MNNSTDILGFEQNLNDWLSRVFNIDKFSSMRDVYSPPLNSLITLENINGRQIKCWETRTYLSERKEPGNEHFFIETKRGRVGLRLSILQEPRQMLSHGVRKGYVSEGSTHTPKTG